ncbi:MAG TPA: DUF3015 family protein [Nitrospira sp.]|nr:DUF3015 family protein [Nitrospira sp.]
MRASLTNGVTYGLAIVIAGMLSGCNTTKATVDTTVKFFSSTSPDSMFTRDGMVEQTQKINLFAGVNYENLRQEAASGQGQYVTSLAILYGVPAAQREDFGRLLQQRHAELFAADLDNDNRAHLKMVSALNRVLAVDASTIRR